MNSSNHPSAYGYQPYGTPGHYYPPKPPIQEDTLHAGRLDVERKTFVLALKENPRGRFLRITEKKGMQHATVIVPATGLKDFLKVLADIIEADAAAAPKPLA